MGLSRGMSHVKNALGSPNVDVAYVCDVDQQRIDRAVSVVEKQNAPKPKGVRDFRRMLEDKERRCHHDRHMQPLARSCHNPCMLCWQTRLR
jgi:hypothetical protein